MPIAKLLPPQSTPRLKLDVGSSSVAFVWRHARTKALLQTHPIRNAFTTGPVTLATLAGPPSGYNCRSSLAPVPPRRCRCCGSYRRADWDAVCNRCGEPAR